MATVIRLKRIGAKKDPIYRIVVADSRARRDGRFVEQLGFYNPQPKEAEVRVDLQRAAYWLGVGALPSDQVRSLFKKVGVPLPSAPSRSKKKPADAAKPRQAAVSAAAREKARRERKRTTRAERKGVRTKRAAQVAAAAKAKEATPAEAAE